MANPLWPTNLPSPIGESDPQYTLADNSIRSKMEIGPPKVRRRYSGRYETMKFSLVLVVDPNTNRNDYTPFQTFYFTTVQEVLPFDWVDWRDGTTKTYRFAKPPVMTYVVGDSSKTGVAGWWKVDCELEIIY